MTPRRRFADGSPRAGLAGQTPRVAPPPVSQQTKRIKVFWFFFSKKNKRFFLKKEAKTFYPFSGGAGKLRNPTATALVPA